jgi:hypothetical protein
MNGPTAKKTTDDCVSGGLAGASTQTLCNHYGSRTQSNAKVRSSWLALNNIQTAVTVNAVNIVHTANTALVEELSVSGALFCVTLGNTPAATLQQLIVHLQLDKETGQHELASRPDPRAARYDGSEGSPGTGPETLQQVHQACDDREEAQGRVSGGHERPGWRVEYRPGPCAARNLTECDLDIGCLGMTELRVNRDEIKGPGMDYASVPPLFGNLC